MENYKETRPWGSFENLLDSEYCKVKEIIIKKGGRPSYQYHHKRSEVWTIVQGEATVTLDGQVRVYKAGEAVIVPVGMAHRVENKNQEELKFIEVQTGAYFGEDDIVRLEDDYGRS
jgi:mannose-6-phosphate isomerase